MSDHLRGITLIESLAALLVVSVGMVGIAALYGRALAASGSAIYRSQAIVLASDMVERIRANPAATTTYAGPAGDEPCALPAEPCSASELAADDLRTWQQLIARSLPGGAGIVTVDAGATPVTYKVSVSWRESAEPAPATFSHWFRLSRS